MILHKVVFGAVAPNKRQEACNAVESYLASLVRNGQADEQFFVVTYQGRVMSHVLLLGIHALLPRYHSKWGRKHLKEVAAIFGHPPRWTVAEDDPPRRDTTWAKAPFLYLFTHAFDHASPLCRGDNGYPIPLYRVPVPDDIREGVGHWQSEYREHDGDWLSSGPQELAAYRQLADPSSELSREGLDCCRDIQKATGVPTYYFLMRYWGRAQGEEARRCPQCGGRWRTKHPLLPPRPYWQFGFQCHRCRLVSHGGDAFDNRRFAHIGEYHKRQNLQKSR